jgi:hypothetical protein
LKRPSPSLAQNGAAPIGLQQESKPSSDDDDGIIFDFEI